MVIYLASMCYIYKNWAISSIIIIKYLKVQVVLPLNISFALILHKHFFPIPKNQLEVAEEKLLVYAEKI